MQNKRDILTMLKEAGILFAITLIAGVLLGFVYELTKEPIAEQRRLKVQRACAEVFETANSFEEKQVDANSLLTMEAQQLMDNLASNGVVIGTVYTAVSTDGKALGYVIKTTTKKGFGGPIELMLGVSMDGTVNGISILSISETPGLGMNAEDDLAPQFAGKNVEGFIYTKTGAVADNEVDVISGATVTTKAITSAVNGAIEYFNVFLQEGGNE